MTTRSTPTDPLQPNCEAHEHAPTHPLRVHAERTLARASGFFRAAGDIERLRLLGHLLDSERCVSDLAASLGESMSTVSQRLRLLRTEGLIVRRRDGKHIYYALADAHVASLLESALAHAAEEPNHEASVRRPK